MSTCLISVACQLNKTSNDRLLTHGQIVGGMIVHEKVTYIGITERYLEIDSLNMNISTLVV